jgi:hypothetical protein
MLSNKDTFKNISSAVPEGIIISDKKSFTELKGKGERE